MSDRSSPVERQWFHEAHGLHDDAHHQTHRPLDLCVPLVFRSDYDSLVQKLQAAEERATDRDYWYGQARNRAFRNAQDELQSTKPDLAKDFSVVKDACTRVPGVPVPNMYLNALARIEKHCENAEAQFSDIRRQMEELREKGLWPIVALVEQLETYRSALDAMAPPNPLYPGDVGRGAQD